MEHEELLLLTNLSMITLSSLLKELEVSVHQLLIRERNTVDSLERVVGGVTQEVRRGVFQKLESLDAAGVRNMGTTAKIDQRTTSVDGSRGAIRNFRRDKSLLVLVVREHLEKVLLGNNESLKLLLLLDSRLGPSLNVGKFRGMNGTLTIINAHFIEETVIGGGTDTKVSTIEVLASLTKNVGRGMPKDLLSLFVVEIEKIESGITFEGTLEIPKLTVDLGDNNTIQKGFADVFSDFKGGGLVRGTLNDLAVFEGDLDRETLFLGNLLIVFLL